MASDKCIGAIALTVALTFLAFLFLKLFIIPILPLDEDIQKQLLPPTYILATSGLFGLVFMGSLTVYTFYLLYNKNN